MIKFNLLCSGSKGNSCLIEDGDTKVLIDCGSTKKYLLSSLENLNIKIEDLDGLVITHDHSDHISQIRFFKEIPIYSPVTIEEVDTFTVRPMQEFTIGSLRFVPVPLSHDAPATTGYCIDNGAEKLVYITDTGYLNQRYISLLSDADYYIFESNHDVSMLMQTSRPQYIKRRICSDEGHLNNEDCAVALSTLISSRTRMIVLAHISQQGNTRQKALEVTCDYLLKNRTDLNQDLIVAAAGQFEWVAGGGDNEEVDPGSVYRAIGLEYRTDSSSVDTVISTCR